MPFETPPATVPSSDPSSSPASARTEVSCETLISRTVSIWRKNMAKYLGLTLVTMIPVVVATAIAINRLDGIGGSGGDFGAAIAGSFAVVAMFLVLTPLCILSSTAQIGGLTHGAIQQLAGRPVRFGGMLSILFVRAWPLLVAGLSYGLMIMAGLLLFVVPGIAVACVVSIAIPAVVTERLGPVAAIKRSWKLTQKHREPVFMSLFVLVFISVVINLLIQNLSVVLGEMAGTLLSAAVNICLSSLILLLPAVAYHDLRLFKEGASSEELANAFE
jgi:membrane-anchored glycerophosphoryl diester phosphodiesterase (GDPDase)